ARGLLHGHAADRPPEHAGGTFLCWMVNLPRVGVAVLVERFQASPVGFRANGVEPQPKVGDSPRDVLRALFRHPDSCCARESMRLWRVLSSSLPGVGGSLPVLQSSAHENRGVRCRNEATGSV